MSCSYVLFICCRLKRFTLEGTTVEYRRAEFQHSPLGGSIPGANDYNNHPHQENHHDPEDIKVCFSAPSTPPSHTGEEHPSQAKQKVMGNSPRSCDVGGLLLVATMGRRAREAHSHAGIQASNMSVRMKNAVQRGGGRLSGAEWGGTERRSALAPDRR
ncbi:LOW QUALITY PROTEIN: Protein of unknown function [Gryllus bimaculatus]|nr:LOW QUALITY PROTEIN: Protein of unknown function [Gryllus bimaculatus]